MSATIKNYIGYEALNSYLLSERKNWSYCGFLNLNQDIIISSLISLTNDSPLTLDMWENFDTVIAEHLQHKRNLQTFWQGIIKKYKKENQENNLASAVTENPKEQHTITTVTSLPKETPIDQPTVTSITSLSKETIDQNLIPTVISVTSFPKETVKTSVKNLPKTSQQNFSKKNIKFINFCYDILHKLEDNPHAHLFYKYNEENIGKIIEDPIDLFTVNSKLENNQYTNLEEFENDIRLIFRNCYTYNYVKSEIYCSGKALEIDFNKKWNEKLIFQTRKKGELKRVRDIDTDTDNSSFTRFHKKQNQILEENKNNIIYQQVINDVFPVASAYENLVMGNIIPFIEVLKTFLLTRSQMSLASANESMLQAIVESLLPLKYRIPELSLVMDGKKPKGSGRFGYLDIFVLKGIGDNYASLELKYISLVGLIQNQNTKYGANELENLDKILEKENEEFLLKRPYTYWSKENKKTNQTTIGEILNNGIDQLKSYINIISKGKPVDYSSSGVLDESIKITKSESNILKGYIILVVGFR
ncbi:hypothetical protein GLOIN_2v1781474 [Rhizophagus clarus]|uniref:Bromo domain-containing protein n=1 Tax=Rhizophagus clarus TaxID=94130 RepID=A0A8H3R7Z4_9GLOM|nr:hypothetical protein GLOIN_2v1781474 [Rhizophagus clarus]